MQTFSRKLASFSDRCAFVLVPLPFDLSSLLATELLLQSGGRLKKQDLILCAYKLIFCLRFQSWRLKNTQNLLKTSKEDSYCGQSFCNDKITAWDLYFKHNKNWKSQCPQQVCHSDTLQAAQGCHSMARCWGTTLRSGDKAQGQKKELAT